MNMLVIGFFGEGNLGDEAILEGLIRSLPQGWRMIVTAGIFPSPPSRRIPRRGLASWPAFLRALRVSRKVMCTGGILQDWSLDGVTFYALRLLAASLAGRTPALWGAGIGPLRHPAARAVAARVLRRTGPIWVRDVPSMRLALELTAPVAHLGCDWSWAIPGRAVAAPSAAAIPFVAHRIGLNLRPWPRECFLAGARAALTGVPRERLLGVAARGEDRSFLQREFPGICVEEPSSFADLMDLGSRLEMGVAMRFHVVLAWLRARRPLIPLAYDDKVVALCHEAGIHDVGPGRRQPTVPAPDFPARSFRHLADMQAAFSAWLAASDHPEAHDDSRFGNGGSTGR